MIETLHFQPAIKRPDLVASGITTLLQNWVHPIPVEDIWAAEIDPSVANGQSFCERYGIPTSNGANCVIVEAIRHEKRTLAACLALVGHQMDFNGLIKKHFNARRVSLAPLPFVLQETNMEYGSITALGLPAHWPILLDAQLLQTSRIIIGSGLIKSKISLPVKALTVLPGTIVIEELASTKMSCSR